MREVEVIEAFYNMKFKIRMICYFDEQVPVVSDAACEASSSTEVTVGVVAFCYNAKKYLVFSNAHAHLAVTRPERPKGAKDKVN